MNENQGEFTQAVPVASTQERRRFGLRATVAVAGLATMVGGLVAVESARGAEELPEDGLAASWHPTGENKVINCINPETGEWELAGSWISSESATDPRMDVTGLSTSPSAIDSGSYNADDDNPRAGIFAIFAGNVESGSVSASVTYPGSPGESDPISVSGSKPEDCKPATTTTSSTTTTTTTTTTTQPPQEFSADVEALCVDDSPRLFVDVTPDSMNYQVDINGEFAYASDVFENDNNYPIEEGDSWRVYNGSISESGVVSEDTCDDDETTTTSSVPGESTTTTSSVPETPTTSSTVPETPTPTTPTPTPTPTTQPPVVVESTLPGTR